MVTDTYSGTASGQALFNHESCVSRNHLSAVIGSLVPAAEQ